uniref:Bridging integrator 3 n=1 Tax=Anser brachyrhynchus TaxID=132585 RepID=A0A8B9CIA3_9AVES
MLSRAQEAPLQGTELPADPEVVPAVCWIPFKIGQPKKQIVPKTVERDFEREYGKLQQLEDQTKKLQKDMKKSTDADLAMSKSAVKISSDLLSNPLCEQEPGFLEMVTAFDTAMKRMDSFNQEKVRVALGGAGGARGVAPSLPATSSFPLCPHLRGVSPIKLSTHAFSDAGCAGGFSARGKDCSFLVKGHPRCRSSRGRRRANAFPTSLACNHPSCFQQVNQIQKTVIEPLKKFSSVFPSLNMAVKRREQTLQDYKRLQSKVEKYEEKERTGPVLAKLHQAREELRPVKEDFEAKNKQLLEEMPKFYSSRIDYFKPSFESLVRAQVVYYTEMHKIFGDLTAQIDQPGLSDEQRERENEAKLSELRALSIVADD